MKTEPRRQNERLPEFRSASMFFIIFLSSCDICPARLFFRAGINVLLSSKAEISPETRHDCAVF
jgi:hypothetical protein